MFFKLYILMILCHIIDDFVLQPICLSKLKQESWWLKQEEYCSKYKDDYKTALGIHSMSWSAMIHLPIMFFLDVSGVFLFISFVVNAFIHYLVDDAKANKKKINLCVDQHIHFAQLFITLFLWCFFV